MWLTFSILAAFCFGLRGILYHWTSQQPLSRNLLLFGTFTSGAIINLAGALMFSSEWTTACLVGVMMGLFSFGANASMFKGFAEGKASLVAILTALPPVFVVILALVFWNEQPQVMQWISFVIIVSGILLVRYSNDITLRNLQGAQWGLLAMILFAFNDLSGKWSTILSAELFPTMFFMFITGSICFGAWWMRDRRAEMQRTQQLAAAGSQGSNSYIAAAKEGSWSISKTFVVGLGVGITNAVGMMLLLTAFDHGKTGLVSAVSASSVLIVLLYTRFVVKEKFSKAEVAGISIAFAGIIIMRLFGA
ncbi:DMT family transporter [Paenibacillus sp. IITD108]|uniref:DMT family transporter n=1 Tax=Paenibacillus sp. IITD108 TaxID=3116649 RepID=UPI002F3F6ECD